MQEIIKKFKFRDAATVLNCPPQLKKEFVALGFKTEFAKNKSANTLVFLNDKKELADFLTADLKNIERDSVLWLAFPKGTSKIKTDIGRDVIRETAESFGLATVTAVSVNEIWSALRLRPLEMVGK
ncbi:DUF3052 family protein [Kaistella palustris]|uniref:DUF3052 family protein n=1 Tax=Kaistella palustris TaxID=493376 RepID=UPI000421027D|nr:DUF3052 family protein [Kaistella palustris]